MIEIFNSKSDFVLSSFIDAATTQTRINDLSTTIEILSPNRFFQIGWPFPCPMFFADLDQLN